MLQCLCFHWARCRSLSPRSWLCQNKIFFVVSDLVSGFPWTGEQRRWQRPLGNTSQHELWLLGTPRQSVVCKGRRILFSEDKLSCFPQLLFGYFFCLSLNSPRRRHRQGE